MSKYFVIDPSVKFSTKEEIEKRQSTTTKAVNDRWEKAEEQRLTSIQKYPPIIAPKGKVIVVVDMQFKNYTSFNDGTKIRLERQFNNLNRRETEPVNAIVINSEQMPQGAEVLIHHNSTHDTNRIFGCEELIGEEISSDVKYFSIKESECFLWRNGGGEWQPCTVFATALRVFTTHNGILMDIQPAQLNNMLYVTSGELYGNVVATLKGCDYCIVFQDINGKENQVIRFRPDGDIDNDREAEAIAILHDITNKVKTGELLIGITPSDAHPYNSASYTSAMKTANRGLLKYKSISVL